MTRAAKHNWTVAQGFIGWVQAGKKGPERKCAAHYIAKAKDAKTACGLMDVRGKTPSKGFAHYKLQWFTLSSSAAATGSICRECDRVAPKVEEEVA